MPGTSPSAIKTGSVQIKYADGTEHTLTVHPITQMQLFRFLDEVGIQDLTELTKPATPATSLRAVRLMLHIVAAALSTRDEVWTVQKVQGAFGDLTDVCKIFNEAMRLCGWMKWPAQATKQKQYT